MAINLGKRSKQRKAADRIRGSVRGARKDARGAGKGALKQVRHTGDQARKRVRRTRDRVTAMMPANRARRERRTRMLFLAGGTAVGAALAALFDPVRGRSRRARLADQAGAFFRRRARKAGRFGRRMASDIEGMRERADYAESDYEAPNDVTLARKVESEVFGRGDVPKGSVVINAEEGVIILRGEVERERQIGDIERLVREVGGVRGVENFLHPKGTLPPNKAEAWTAR